MSLLATFWLISAFFWTAVMSFYSMQEMACISLNRLRLEMSVRSGSQRAAWIQSLLNRPTTLFGTTLIGVNLALVLGSESMRQFFGALQLNPNFSVLVQAPYVLIFGELVPMFAARLFPEHMVRLGGPLLLASSKILSPIALLIDCVFDTIRKFFFAESRTVPLHLQRDELRDLIAVQTGGYQTGESDGLGSIVSRMFALREKEMNRIMVPITQIPSLLSASLCGPSQELLQKEGADLAVVRNRVGRIIGYVQGTDLLAASSSASVGSVCQPATFVGETSTTIDALFRLKKERGTMAFVVGSGGEISGFITLYDILDELTSESPSREAQFHIERTVSGDHLVEEFFARYQLPLSQTKAKTFAGLIEELLGRKPSLHDVVRCGPVELTVKEVGILGAKTIVIKTVY